MMNANNPQTPGVYTVEKTAFPPSVAEVPTAIPAFIGYTEKAERQGKSLVKQPVLINSMNEFHIFFGGAPDYMFPIVEVQKTTKPPAPDAYDFALNGKYYKIGSAKVSLFYMYNCLRMFYLNGGGPAYIVSVGTYMETSFDDKGNMATEPAVADRDKLMEGLDLLPLIQFPKPTMILIPDALTLDKEDCYVIQQQMIAQAGELKDRVALLDIYEGYKGPDTTVISDFRNNMGVSFLSYAIAYYPWLECAVVDAAELTYANLFIPPPAKPGAPPPAPGDPLDIKDVLPGVPLIKILNTINNDYQQLKEDLFITPPIKLGSGAAKTFGSWSEAFNGSPASDAKDILADQGTVLTAMFQVIYDLGKKGVSSGNSNLKISSKDLMANIQLMINKNGPLGSTMALLSDYESSFPGGISPKSVSASITNWGWASAPNANPYPDFNSSLTTVEKQELAFNQAEPVYKKAFNQLLKALNSIVSSAETILIQYNTALENSNANYKSIMTSVARQANILPPTGAMAGVYTLVDNTEGVWHAPANRNIDAVVSPMVSINDDQQAPLNVDALAGKSINVIRSFYGRGPAMIWGARTMDGNSLDWKYISVRRFMILVEQSVANAAFSLVFEPNDSSTWGVCESMINNFLHNLWAQGALQGASPADAYSVMVGLGKTMTPLDILEGIMRVQVKLAVVRPAEFIIITYEQEMAKS